MVRISKSFVLVGNLRTLAALTGLLWLCAYPGPTGCGRSVEYECEEAANQLENCCQASTTVRCLYNDKADKLAEGCNKTPTYRQTETDLQPDVALCIRQKSCEELRAVGACSIKSWYLPEKCSTGSECTCTDIQSRCCEWTTITRCSTPLQSGACIFYRPADACTVLALLNCE